MATKLQIIPSAPEVLREALIVLTGALIAYTVVQLLPPRMKKYFSLNGGNQP